MKRQNTDPAEGLPEMVQQVIDACRTAENDPLGSYTGVAEDPMEEPVQDADDL